MAKGMFELDCPCCHATLKVDSGTRAVISHKEKPRPRTVEDLEEAVQKLKGEEGRRDELFRKSFEAEKSHGAVLAKKFDELFKQAKDDPDKRPPQRDIDLD
jgi:hypothetical protein